MGRSSVKNFFFEHSINIIAILIASLLFAASFPNLLTENGIPLLAWIAFVPVFFLIPRLNIASSIFYGALYGYAAYGLFNYWLSVFHPLAGLIVGVIYLVYFAILFPVLRLAYTLYPKKAYLIQWTIWIAYEYLRTLGFVGYAYGISGYSQWSNLPLIQIASVLGVWGVSALLVFPSAFLGAALAKGIKNIKVFIVQERLPLLLWTVALIGTLVYGFISPLDYTDSRQFRVSLVQHNTDPWRGGLQAYRKNYEVLKGLSIEALNQAEEPELVVWSETAFVPRIYWHTTYRDDHASYELVKELMDFLSQQDVPFLIGNDDARRELSSDGTWKRVDYNAAILFDKGKEVDIYRKLHLVPFTEHFPYEKQLPAIYQALKNADTHFWEKGTEAVVFEVAGVKFSTPICFEDTFGYLSRRFVNEGADIIVNITNDAWAASLPAQMQHFGMAVFRAVENRRSLVRATASGQTCAIDPNGKILAMAEPFKEVQLSTSVPIVDRQTVYTKYGDYFALLFVIVSFIFLAAGICMHLYTRQREKHSA